MSAADFDFWIGSWDVTWSGGARGRNVVEKTLHDQVVLERFDGRPGAALRGISVTVYDRDEAIWRQTWVDNEGRYLQFAGGREGDGMTLRGVTGGRSVRMRWCEITFESLRWLWQQSGDGSSWETLWELAYVRTYDGD